MHEEDKEFIALAKQNKKKYELLYQKYADKVFNYFWYRTAHNKSLAEDMMQETFLRAFKHLDKFRHRGYSYFTYLLQIAHNILVDHWRKPKCESLESLNVDIPYDIIRDIERKSNAEFLWKEIQELPEDSRDILLMRYQDDLPIKDIAKATKSSENAIKLKLSRLRRKLKDNHFVKDIAGFGRAIRKPTKPKFLNNNKSDTFLNVKR